MAQTSVLSRFHFSGGRLKFLSGLLEKNESPHFCSFQSIDMSGYNQRRRDRGEDGGILPSAF